MEYFSIVHSICLPQDIVAGSHNVPLHEIPDAFLLPAEEFAAKYGFPLPDKEAKNTVLTWRFGTLVIVTAVFMMKIDDLSQFL